MIIDHDEPDVERISDESDRASKLEQVANEEGVARVLRSIEKAPSDFDGKTCVDCGQEIPAARLATGAFRDIHCQQKAEFNRNTYRR